MSIREKYIDGSLYKVGDIVVNRNHETLHEIVDLGTNYLSVVNEAGDITKMWLSDAVIANELKEDFNDLRRKRSSSSQIAYVGYKTKHFNKEIYEAFRQTVGEKASKSDRFLTLNLIRQTDVLIESINEIDAKSYPRVKALFEQTNKYIDKLDVSRYHGYRTEFLDKLNTFELSENLNMTNVDKDRAVGIFADAIKKDVSHLSSHEEKVNAIARHVKTGRWSPEAWKGLGAMFNLMTKSGIKWDKNIFMKTTQKAMGLA